MSNYEKLAAINVNDKLEKKNGLSYLSWAFAVDTLMRADPEANWTYLEPLQFGDTLMVRCAVTAFGKTMVCQLPVMDYKNRAIPQPDAFAVNTAMQRCLVKAIALHGLGLYIYAGEDLPEGEEKPEPKKVSPISGAAIKKDAFDDLTPDLQRDFMAKVEQVRAQLDAGNQDGGYDIYAEFRDSLEDAAHKAALRGLFSSAEQSILTKQFNKRKEKEAA